MIKGIWKSIEVYCGNHDEPIQMIIQQGPHSLFYACPKYQEENRTRDERACPNRINLVDYEKMIDILSKQIEDAEHNFEMIDLNHFSWTDKKGISFEVFDSDQEKIKIKMLNKRALK